MVCSSSEVRRLASSCSRGAVPTRKSSPSLSSGDTCNSHTHAPGVCFSLGFHSYALYVDAMCRMVTDGASIARFLACVEDKKGTILILKDSKGKVCKTMCNMHAFGIHLCHVLASIVFLSLCDSCSHPSSFEMCAGDVMADDSLSLSVWRAQIFGGFASEPWSNSGVYEGGGESFVYHFAPKLSVYRWTGVCANATTCPRSLECTVRVWMLVSSCSCFTYAFMCAQRRTICSRSSIIRLLSWAEGKHHQLYHCSMFGCFFLISSSQPVCSD